MFSQGVKRFQKLEENGEFEKAGEMLDSLSARLSPRLFIPNSGEYSQGFVKTMISTIIPYVAHRETVIRTKSSNLLNHWLAVATSFCPKEVIKACTGDERLMYPPAGQAILLTWFAHALSSLPKTEQSGYAKICQSMAFHSTAVTLKDLPMQFWTFMRIHLSIPELNEVLLPLSHPDLAPAAAFICRKSMVVMAKSVLAIASMEFVAKFIAALRRGEDRIDSVVVCERVANSLQESDSSIVSAGIEVLIQLLNFIWWNPSEEEIMFLTPLCYTMRRLVDTESTLCVHRAGCIEALVTCSSHGVVSIDDVLPFVSFGGDEPAPIQMACLKVSFVLIEKDEMRKDIFGFYETVTRERDPILFAEFLERFAENYSKLRNIDETLTLKLVNSCLSPIPTYYVEQLRVLWLLRAMPLADLIDERLCVRPDMIVSEFVKKPSPQVVPELKRLLEYLDIEVGVNQLSWFDDSVSMSLELVSKLDPHMILELLDIGQISSSCLPSCLDVLKANPQLESAHCMGQCLSLLNIMMDVLGMKRFVGAKKYPFGSDDSYALWLTRDAIQGLFRLMNTLIVESVFGQVFHSVCSAISAYLPFVPLTGKEYNELIDIMTGIMFTFCEASCETLLHITKTLQSSSDEKIAKKSGKLLEKIRSGCEKFLSSEVSDNLPAIIAIIQILGVAPFVEQREELIVAAAGKSREVASLIVESKVEMMLPFMPTFLSFVGHQTSEWIDQCKEKFPFNEWILIDGDENIISPDDLRDVDQNTLDGIHRAMVEKVLGQRPETSREASFDYEEPQIEKGLQMHKGGSDYLYDVKSFLWHSPLSSSVPFEELESFCLARAKDTDLTLGFLSYAYSRGLSINTDEWMKSIQFDTHNKYSYLSLIQLLRFIQCDWEEMPEAIRDFIVRICAKFDINEYDPDMIAHQYSAREDIEKELFYAIMGIDKKTYAHIFNLESETGKQEQLEMILNSLEMAFNEISVCSTFQKLVRIFFENASFAESPRILAPRGLELPKMYMKFDDITEPQPSPALSAANANLFISSLLALESPDVVVIPEVLSIFVHMQEPSPDLVELIEKYAIGDKLFLAVLIKKQASHEAFFDFFFGRTPSTSRAFFRLTQLLESVSLRQDTTIRKSLKPIHPGFGYFAMGSNGIPVQEGATPLDLVRYGMCSTADVFAQLKIATRETVDLYDSFNRILDVDPTLFPEEDATITRINASTVVGALMSDREVDITVLCRLFDVFVRSLSMEPLSALFCNRDFFNNGNILSVSVLFHKFERYANEKEDVERIEMCRLFRDPESGIFEDASRIDFFNNCLGNEALVTSCLQKSEL